jgi:transposase
MSARGKQSAVLRLLRGEDLELVSRELGVTAAELSAWRDAFLAAGEASLTEAPPRRSRVSAPKRPADGPWRPAALWRAGGRDDEPPGLALHEPAPCW